MSDVSFSRQNRPVCDCCPPLQQCDRIQLFSIIKSSSAAEEPDLTPMPNVLPGNPDQHAANLRTERDTTNCSAVTDANIHALPGRWKRRQPDASHHIYIASRGRVGCYNWYSTEGGISCQIPLSMCTKRSRPPTKSSVLTSSVSLSMSMVIAETLTTGPAIVIKLLTGRPSDHGPYCALLPADQVRRRSDDDSS